MLNRRTIFGVVLLFIASTLCFIYAQQITSWLGAQLPLGARIKSKGSYYPYFSHETGFTFQLKSFSVLIFISTVLLVYSSVKAERCSLLLESAERFLEIYKNISVFTLTIAAGALYTYLAYPSNMHFSNARVHWLDVLLLDVQFPYFLVRLNKYFFDYPYLMHGLLGATIIFFFYKASYSLTRRYVLAFSAAFALLLSSNMIKFAFEFEDVLINLAAIVFMLYCYTARRPYATAFGLFLVFLGRPYHIVFLAGMGLAELFFLIRPNMTLKDFLTSYIAKVCYAFCALLCLWGTLLTELSYEHLYLKMFKIVKTYTPIEIDGFVISQFSGAYIGHLWWVFPISFMVFMFLCLINLKKLALNHKRLVLTSLFTCIIYLTMIEGNPGLYFNHRYLVYLLPFLSIASWCIFDTIPQKNISIYLTVLFLLTFSLATPMNFALQDREYVQSLNLTPLFEKRFELREAVGDKSLYVDIKVMGKMERNYLAFIFKRPSHVIYNSKDMKCTNKGIILTDSLDKYSKSDVLYTTKGFVLVKAD